jgi:hypothetical protein
MCSLIFGLRSIGGLYSHISLWEWAECFYLKIGSRDVRVAYMCCVLVVFFLPPPPSCCLLFFFGFVFCFWVQEGTL